jgi:hypothetical protein
MSVCYEFVCVDCKKVSWVAQRGSKDEPLHFYKTVLDTFLQEHQGHNLRFMEDQDVIDEYGNVDNEGNLIPIPR